MATDLSFVPGRNAGSENPILNGFRFILNRKKNDSTYWKCALFRTGCSARITTVDKQLVSPVPVHSHEVQHAENTVHIAMMGAIAFVPVDEVEQTWRHLKPLIPSDMESFATYYENTWIGTSSRSPLFAHEMWNQHDASLMLLPRSTNIAEGWHRGFNSMMSCTNPTLWKFIDCLRAEQSLTDAKLTKRLLRERPEPRGQKWIPTMSTQIKRTTSKLLETEPWCN